MTDSKDVVERFTDAQVDSAVRQWLEYGASEFKKSHRGYFVGPGFAARCLAALPAELTRLRAELAEANERAERLRDALIGIRDSTMRTAFILRAKAELAIDIDAARSGGEGNTND